MFFQVVFLEAFIKKVQMTLYIVLACQTATSGVYTYIDFKSSEKRISFIFELVNIYINIIFNLFLTLRSNLNPFIYEEVLLSVERVTIIYFIQMAMIIISQKIKR